MTTFRNDGRVGNLGQNQYFYGNIYHGSGPDSQQERGQEQNAGNRFDFGLNLFNAPEIDDGLFVGRGPEIQQMHTQLQPNPISPRRKVMILGGVGGIGKTQLAINYAKRYRDSYASIFWMNATSETTLKESFQLIIQRVMPQYQHEGAGAQGRLLNWFSDRSNSRWLLIFDNHDEPEEYNISTYFPYASQGSIIITTREPGLVNGEKLRLSSMAGVDDGLRILEMRSGRRNVAYDLGARRLAQRLAGFPLALATAGAYLSQTAISFQSYLDEYDAKWNINPDRPVYLPEYSKTMTTTWDMSFTRLQRHDPDAANLLKFLAYMGNQNIAYELVAAGARPGAPTWLINATKDHTSFDNILGVLVASCFIEAHPGTGVYSMHAAVYDWTLAGLNNPIDEDLYWTAVSCVTLYTKDLDLNTLPIMWTHPLLTEHALRLIHSSFHPILRTSRLLKDNVASMLRVCYLLHRLRYFGASETMTLFTLAAGERHFGQDHIFTLDAMEQLSRTYLDQGRVSEGRGILEKVLVAKMNKFGPEDVSTIATIRLIGGMAQMEGRLEEAAHADERVLFSYQRIFGTYHLQTLLMAKYLGYTYHLQNRLLESQSILQKACAGIEAQLGPHDLRTWEIKTMIGIVNCIQGNDLEAMQLFRRVYAERERYHGPDHIATLQSSMDIAVAKFYQGRFEESIRTARQIADIFKARLHPEAQIVIIAVKSLDQMYEYSSLPELERVDRISIRLSWWYAV